MKAFRLSFQGLFDPFIKLLFVSRVIFPENSIVI
jgi:hypothetical protein